MVGCIGVSEVGAGSDVAGLKTSARKDGDDYVINGSKMWITNSPSADFICLLANTSDDKPHVNKSLIMVPMNTPGISVSPHLDKLGMRSSEPPRCSSTTSACRSATASATKAPAS